MIFLKHDARRYVKKLAAGDLHELMRALGNLASVSILLKHMFVILDSVEETRYPGFYYKADMPGQDDENWFCFVNSSYDKDKNEWSLKRVPYHKLIP